MRSTARAAAISHYASRCECTRPAASEISASYMRILIAHNRYRQSGGEDGVFENEVRLRGLRT